MLRGELDFGNHSLSLVKLKHLSVKELEKLIILKKFFKEKVIEFNELLTNIMDKFEVQQVVGGHYSFEQHPKRKEIEECIKQIREEKLNIPSTVPIKFITLEKLQKSLSDDHKIDDVLILSEILVQDESRTETTE